MTESEGYYKRIGVFVFYDAAGKVDDYVQTLLDSMIKMLHRLIIVVNGGVRSWDYQKLQKYSKEILIRENYGYDAGAYKDVLDRFLHEEDWERWDEIILFNDTFYGPIYPWKDIFGRMEKEEADFWGLSRYPGGGQLSTGGNLPEHIQGYFLACKSSLFLSPDWKEFWNRLAYPRTYLEAVENFEVSFSVFFNRRGYRSRAFTDDTHIDIGYARNPTADYFEELVCDIKFPVIKRKVFCLRCLDAVSRTVGFIKNNTDYDTNLISSHLERLYREGRYQPMAPFDIGLLEEFRNRHERIFIYGHGIYGRGIARYFEYKGWDYEGFLVSANREKDENLMICQEMEFRKEDGIVLALGKEALAEVYQIVRNDLGESQLYYLKQGDVL